jgi:hypothetical protein
VGFFFDFTRRRRVRARGAREAVVTSVLSRMSPGGEVRRCAAQSFGRRRLGVLAQVARNARLVQAPSALS